MLPSWERLQAAVGCQSVRGPLRPSIPFLLLSLSLSVCRSVRRSVRQSLSLLSFFLSTGDKSASGPGPRPPRSPLFGGTGLWGQRLGLQPEVGVAGGVRLLFIPRLLTLSRIPASSPRPLWHYP